MKHLLHLTLNNTLLCALISQYDTAAAEGTRDAKKMQAEYFINGFEITDFDNVLPLYRNLLTELCKDYCNLNGLLLYKH
jgi:hypothetical protein